MKAIGIEIEADELIIIVLERTSAGAVIQTNESTKIKVKDHTDNSQVRQFKEQVESLFQTINPQKIGVRARNAKAKANEKLKVRPPSPVSFKLEGILQLFDECDVSFVWPQTITAFKRKHSMLEAKYAYQQNAADIAYYLLES
jgi:hypothetical protein